MQFTRTTPGALGIPPKAIRAFLKALEEKKLGVHSFMLLRHGQVAAEGWWTPYAPGKKHMLFSLSKSFTSTAVGFAVQEGLLAIDDPVLKFFPDALDGAPCENMRRMQVKHLLTMGTGHDAEPNVFSAKAWSKAFLTSYVAKAPGSLFVYNTPATYMLSCIVQKVTGQKVIGYLRPRLFEPLGIKDITWEESPEGVNTGGFGLNVRTEDIARFAQFLLQRGAFGGKQLLSPDWIDMATSKQISNGDPAQKSDWSQGYGFQFWRCQPEGVFRGDGAFGQYCVVMPGQDACLAITSGSGDIGQILKEAWTHLLPAMGEACPDEGLEELRETIRGLRIPAPEGDAHAEGEAAFTGTYELGENPLNLSRLWFDFSGDTPVFRAEFYAPANGDEAPDMRKSAHDMPIGRGTWLESGEEGEYHTACAGAWQPDGSFLVRMVNDETPFINDVRIRFHARHLDARFTRNVGFGGQSEVRLIAAKQA